MPLGFSTHKRSCSGRTDTGWGKWKPGKRKAEKGKRGRAPFELGVLVRVAGVRAFGSDGGGIALRQNRSGSAKRFRTMPSGGILYRIPANTSKRLSSFRYSPASLESKRGHKKPAPGRSPWGRRKLADWIGPPGADYQVRFL